MGLFKFLKDKFGKNKDVKSSSLENTKEGGLAGDIEKNGDKSNAKSEQISLEKYDKGLEKSRKNFSSKLEALTKKYKQVNEDYFNELEEILIEADCGVSFTLNIIDQLLEESKEKKVTDPKEINEMLVDKMFFNYLKEGEDIKNEIDFTETPRVLLVIGVNGVGKTTSIAKLANRYVKLGKKVVLVAADTFRAGAVEQLGIWAKRLGCDIVTGNANEDPASVAYKGVVYGKENKDDLIIIDTAGRLQNKTNLMNELGKITRVIKKEYDKPIECFLIIDATTGQNGVLQAKAFKDLIDITGIVITKMDGTSKGGIILAIREELGIPVRFIGLGEKMEDLEEFDLDKYLYGLCSGLINDEE
jgi:fused signal recognition particle receptor